MVHVATFLPQDEHCPKWSWPSDSDRKVVVIRNTTWAGLIQGGKERHLVRIFPRNIILRGGIYSRMIPLYMNAPAQLDVSSLGWSLFPREKTSFTSPPLFLGASLVRLALLPTDCSHTLLSDLDVDLRRLPCSRRRTTFSRSERNRWAGNGTLSIVLLGLPFLDLFFPLRRMVSANNHRWWRHKLDACYGKDLLVCNQWPASNSTAIEIFRTSAVQKVSPSFCFAAVFLCWVIRHMLIPSANNHMAFRRQRTPYRFHLWKITIQLRITRLPLSTYQVESWHVP